MLNRLPGPQVTVSAALVSDGHEGRAMETDTRQRGPAGNASEGPPGTDGLQRAARRRVLVVMLALAVTATIATIVSLAGSYRTATQQQALRLSEIAQTSAELIEAEAENDSLLSANLPTVALRTGLHRDVEQFHGFATIGKTGELMVGRTEGDSIVFLLRYHSSVEAPPGAAQPDAHEAVPMWRGLTGATGTMIGPDYAGTLVLAAYRPLPALHAAIVAKIDVAEIRAPFIRTGLLAASVTLLFVLLGTWFVARVGEGSARDLALSEARFRAMFEQAVVGMAHASPDGAMLRVNRHLREMFGLDTVELMSRRLWDILLPGDIPPPLEAFERVRDGRPVGLTMEKRYNRSDGTTFWGAVTIGLVADPGDLHPYLAASVQDITEHKTAEEAARSTLETASDIVRAIPAGLFIYQYEPPDRLVLLDANPAAARLTGLDPSVSIGREFNDLWPEAKTLGITEHYLEVMRTGDTYRVESQDYRDARLEVSLKIEAFRLARNRLAVAFENVTERKRAEEARRESEDKYAQLIENAPYGIYTSTIDGRILSANPAFMKLLGCNSLEEVLHLNLTNDVYVDGAQRERFVQQWGHVDEYRGLETEWKRKDGKHITVRLAGRTVRSDGRLTGFESIVEDTTHAHGLEEQLRQAQKMEAVGRLTGGIAHDFNNELSVILLNAQVMAAALEQGEPVQASDLEDITTSAQRAATITRKLLGFSRKADLVLVPTDLASVVKDISAVLRRLLPESIDIRIEADRAVRVVRADTTAIEQVLLNLASNSRDAMPDGGEFGLSVDDVVVDAEYAEGHVGVTPGTYVCLRVSDTGTGMDAETKARIFEPFFTTKGPGTGTGLGMAMVYGLTNQHGGFINAYSEPGLGTTMRLYFPAVDQEAVAKARPDSIAAVSIGSETILLVEDEPSLRNVAKRVLERLGYIVLTATDGEDALRLFAEQPDAIDLVISDLVMPQMSGRQLYEALKRDYPDVRFMLTSGYTGREASERDGLDPAVPFIHKPWSFGEMSDAVRRALTKGV